MEEHKNNQTFRRGNKNCAEETKNCALRKQIIGVKLDGRKDCAKAVRDKTTASDAQPASEKCT